MATIPPPATTTDMLQELCALSAVAAPHAAALLGGGAAAAAAATSPPAAWELYSAEGDEPAKGIKIEKARGWRGRKPVVLRMTTTLPASVVPKLVDHLQGVPDIRLREAWDINFAAGAVLQDFPSDELCDGRDIVYNATKRALGGLVSPRDFITLRVHKQLADGSYFCVARACEHPSKPPTKEPVRAQTQYFSLCFLPAEDGSWLCEYTVQVELNGMLPRGPIEKGTIDSTKTFLRFVAQFDYSTLEQPAPAPAPETSA